MSEGRIQLMGHWLEIPGIVANGKITMKLSRTAPPESQEHRVSSWPNLYILGFQ